MAGHYTKQTFSITMLVRADRYLVRYRIGRALFTYTPHLHLCNVLKKVRVAVISAKNHKRQRRKRQSVTAKREKSQTPKVLTVIPT